jgi:hypothetical protein
MGKVFVRERLRIGVGAGQPRFRVVAAFETDLKFFVPHLRRTELEQIATTTGSEIIYLARGDESSETQPQHGHGGGHHRRQMRGDVGAE